MSSTAGPDDKTTRPATQEDATTRPVTAVRHDGSVRDAPVGDGVSDTVADTVVDEIPTRETVVAREKEQFGGIKVGSAFFGWLAATGTAVLLTALVAAGGTAVGLATNTDVNDAVDQASNNQTVGLTGIIVLLGILLVSYYCGGYVAGRMARFNGARQGFMVWIWALIAAIVVAALGLVAGYGLGTLSMAGMNSMYTTLLNLPPSKAVFEPASWATAVLLGMGVTIASAVIPARAAAFSYTSAACGRRASSGRQGDSRSEQPL